ncbi:MAG: hypothetical protein ACFFAH_11350 [Promethearchaeota archaeon]
MGTLSEHCYAFPFLAGVLTLIALITPAAHYISDDTMYYGIYVWMWGLLVVRDRGHSNFKVFNREWEDFVQYWGLELFGIVPSLICTGMIIVGSLVFIWTAQKVKAGNMDEDKAAKIWAFFAILNIGLTIFWIIWIEYYYAGVYQIIAGEIRIVNPEEDHIGFWAFYNLGFGVIGVFLGAAIALIGVYVK